MNTTDRSGRATSWRGRACFVLRIGAMLGIFTLSACKGASGHMDSYLARVGNTQPLLFLEDSSGRDRARQLKGVCVLGPYEDEVPIDARDDVAYLGKMNVSLKSGTYVLQPKRAEWRVVVVGSDNELVALPVDAKKYRMARVFDFPASSASFTHTPLTCAPAATAAFIKVAAPGGGERVILTRLKE